MDRNDQSRLLAQFGPQHSKLVDLAHTLGVDGINRVLDTFGGEKVHIPTRDAFWDGLYRNVRDETIRAQFRGNNLGELAIEYRLTERQVRNILDKK